MTTVELHPHPSPPLSLLPPLNTRPLWLAATQANCNKVRTDKLHLLKSKAKFRESGCASLTLQRCES